MKTATLAAAPLKVTNLELHARLVPLVVSSVTVVMIVSPALTLKLPGTLLLKFVTLKDVLLVSTEMVIAKNALGSTVIPALMPLSVSPVMLVEPLMVLVLRSMVRLALVSVPAVPLQMPMAIVNLALLVAILAIKISQHVLNVLAVLDSMKIQKYAMLALLVITPLITSAINVLIPALLAPMLTLV